MGHNAPAEKAPQGDLVRTSKSIAEKFKNLLVRTFHSIAKSLEYVALMTLFVVSASALIGLIPVLALVAHPLMAVFIATTGLVTASHLTQKAMRESPFTQSYF